MSDQQLAAAARTRHFLEQMMIRFTSLGVPVPQAAGELVEIESHIGQSDVDPFDEFGDPAALANSLIPPDQLLALRKRDMRNNLLVGFTLGSLIFTAIQTGLTFFDRHVVSAPAILALYVLAVLFAQWSMAFSSIINGTFDDSDSLRPRGIALGFLSAFVGVAILLIALLLAGANLSDANSFDAGTRFWLGASITSIALGIVIALKAWRPVAPEAALIEGGITGQILYEMENNGYRTGWVQYGPRGEDLRDPNYSLREVIRTTRDEIRTGLEPEES